MRSTADNPSDSASYILTRSCPARPGIGHASLLCEAGANILDSAQFGDRASTRFFMRVHFRRDLPAGCDAHDALESLRAAFAGLGTDHAMDADQLAAIGRDVECVALARAVKWHAEHRVLRNGGRTMVFL